MNKFLKMTKRNTKLFFKDKGMFFTSLITPIILLVLYAVFLGKIFKDTYIGMIPQGIEVSNKILNGLAGGQLMSSLLSVSCVTVAFCANMLMVQDKLNGAKKDLMMTKLKKSTLSLSYYVATLISTLIISVCATIISFIYLACVGWFLSVSDCVEYKLIKVSNYNQTIVEKNQTGVFVISTENLTNSSNYFVEVYSNGEYVSTTNTLNLQANTTSNNSTQTIEKSYDWVICIVSLLAGLSIVVVVYIIKAKNK